MRKLRYLKRRLDSYMHEESNKKQKKTPLSGSIKEDIKEIEEVMVKSSDLKVNRFRFGENEEYSGAMIFIDGLTNNLLITESILRPIKSWSKKVESDELIDAVHKEVLCASDSKITTSIEEIVDACLDGDTVVIIDGQTEAINVDTKGWEKRAITEPQSETVVRGPREGFTEDMRTNTALIRRKIRYEKLKSELMTVGRKTKTSVCLMYIDGVADERVIETVKKRLQKIDVDAILETGYIEEYIEDAPFSPFATVSYSEKPDVIAGKILEGRVAIVVDGTPFVMTVPMLFIESFQTAEDYYTRPFYASLIRIIRYLAYFITIYAPAINVALLSFHHELIPTRLLFTLAQATEGTPFPVFLEALIMIFAFELLREAGIRLPRPVGQTISIVGALIMGEAAVSAGLVDEFMVITIAVTAVAGYIVPTQNESASILRIMVLIPAAVMGFYGIVLATLGIMIHLATLKSFGVPYSETIGYADYEQDFIIRMPLWMMFKRPKHIAKGDTTRIKPFIPPLRPHDEAEE